MPYNVLIVVAILRFRESVIYHKQSSLTMYHEKSDPNVIKMLRHRCSFKNLLS